MIQYFIFITPASPRYPDLNRKEAINRIKYLREISFFRRSLKRFGSWDRVVIKMYLFDTSEQPFTLTQPPLKTGVDAFKGQMNRL